MSIITVVFGYYQLYTLRFLFAFRDIAQSFEVQITDFWSQEHMLVRYLTGREGLVLISIAPTTLSVVEDPEAKT